MAKIIHCMLFILILNSILKSSYSSNDFEVLIYTNYANCDYFGHDIKILSSENVHKCGRLCHKALKCTHFTYNEKQKLCYLKHNTNMFVPSYYSGASCGFSYRTSIPIIYTHPFSQIYNWNTSSMGIPSIIDCLDKYFDANCEWLEIILETTKPPIRHCCCWSTLGSIQLFNSYCLNDL